MPGLILNDHPEYSFPDRNFLVHELQREAAIKVITSGKLKSMVHILLDADADFFKEGWQNWDIYTISFSLNINLVHYTDQHECGFIMPLNKILSKNTCITASGFFPDSANELRLAPLKFVEESQQIIYTIATLRNLFSLYIQIADRIYALRSYQNQRVEEKNIPKDYLLDSDQMKPYMLNEDALKGLNYELPPVLKGVIPYNFCIHSKHPFHVNASETILDLHSEDLVPPDGKRLIYAFPSYVAFVMGYPHDDLPGLYYHCAELCRLYFQAATKKFADMHGEVTIDIAKDDAIFIALKQDRD